jgi:radical SAM protein with 4Fe4S-binding SPASM domain
MTRTSIHSLHRLIDILASLGFRRVTLLRYKPQENIQRWLCVNPDRNDLALLEKTLPELVVDYPEILFRIDCALCFLERKLNTSAAKHAGIRGCVAFDRIMAITPDGSVYPCSQLIGDAFKAGNILNMDFDAIWHESRAAQQYRSFRHRQDYKTTSCGICRSQQVCGGCRIFAGDFIGADTGCPETALEEVR